MQIILKQSDIEKSLKDYITAQGICTESKTVQIVFTAGRRGTGITAELTIKDSAEAAPLPKQEVISPKDTLRVDGCGIVVGFASETPTEKVETTSANDPEPEVAPVKTTSLFG